ncbi:YoaK family protein [Methylocella sp.]|uniref:YoaK family protein n=1 Tax=Methylocella sp. TaxID=1978226 RepID=UPI003783C8BB
MTTIVIQEHPEKIRFPLMEDRTVGFILAFMAGLLNAWTLAHAQTFATVQSGNVVQSGYRLVQGDWPAFVFSLGSVLAFGLGSGLCGMLMTTMLRGGRVFTPVVLGFECVALAGLGVASRLGVIDPHVVAYAVSFVAGAQGNAFHKNHGMLYGNVAVTFVVQMAFNFLVQGLFKKNGINSEPNLMWAGVFFSVLLGFAAGGGLGFYVDLNVLNHASLFISAALALILTAMALRNPKTADPTQGGLIG